MSSSASQLLPSSSSSSSALEPDNLDVLIKRNHKNIRAISKVIRESRINNGGGSKETIITTCGKKRKLETELANLKSDQKRLKNIKLANSNNDNIAVVGGGSGVRKSPRIKWCEIESAFKGRIQTGSVINLEHSDVEEFLWDAFRLVRFRLRKALKKLDCLKVNFVFCGDFIKPGQPSDVTYRKYLTTKNREILQSDDIYSAYRSALDELKVKFEQFEEGGSGFALKAIINLTVNINAFNPIKKNNNN